MVFGYFGQIFYISLLFTNAIAILNEERFLAKSRFLFFFIPSHPLTCLSFHLNPSSTRMDWLEIDTVPMIVGWSTRTPQQVNAGFGHAPNTNMYDSSAFGGGNDGGGVKAKLVNLIGATRTLMRSKWAVRAQVWS